MTLENLMSALNAIAPAAYLAFKEKTKPPYIIYALSGDEDVMADNEHYLRVADGFVELYTQSKDLQTQAMLEAALRKLGVAWEKENEDYIPDQRIMYVRWHIQFITEEIADG